MTTHTVTPWSGSWSNLRGVSGIEGWLWLDTTGHGLHEGSALPEPLPAGLSHVWGWGPGERIRVRHDVDLPNGLVGALLRWSSTDGLMERRLTPWQKGQHEIALQDPILRDPSRSISVIDVAHETASTRGDRSLTTLQFIALSEGRR